MTNKKTYQLALVRGAGDTYVTVNDPFRGQKYVAYDSLLAGYGEPGGTWLSTWALSR